MAATRTAAQNGHLADALTGAPADPPVSPGGIAERLMQAVAGQVRSRVPVADLVYFEDQLNRGIVAMLMARPPDIHPIPVVKLRDGRLLAFDDFHSVVIWQRTSPGALIDVDIVPFDFPA